MAILTGDPIYHLKDVIVYLDVRNGVLKELGESPVALIEYLRLDLMWEIKLKYLERANRSQGQAHADIITHMET